MAEPYHEELLVSRPRVEYLFTFEFDGEGAALFSAKRSFDLKYPVKLSFHLSANDCEALSAQFAQAAVELRRR